MKIMLKGIVVKSMAVVVMLFAASSMQAQEAAPAKASCSKTCTKGKGMKKQAFIESLSEDQKATYLSLKEQREAARASIEATFSPEQLAIANNTELDKKAKREALKETFTEAQKEQMKANRQANRNAKEAFVSTLTEDQKALMPKGHKGKKAGKRAHEERKG